MRLLVRPTMRDKRSVSKIDLFHTRHVPTSEVTKGDNVTINLI